jgi:hypothetical protein
LRRRSRWALAALLGRDRETRPLLKGHPIVRVEPICPVARTPVEMDHDVVGAALDATQNNLDAIDASKYYSEVRPDVLIVAHRRPGSCHMILCG